MLGILWTISYAFVVVGLSVFGLHRLWLVLSYFKVRQKNRTYESKFASLPVVTIQLPLFNERYVAERLLQSVCEIEYPKEKLEIQVLDDSTDDTRELIAQKVKQLQHELGLNIEHMHRTDRTGYKAGALQHGLQLAQGEFIAIFDADFLPSRNILMDTIHYFTDDKVGMIQTRWGHLNRNYNFLTRIQAMLLDGHLLIEQTVRNRFGRFFNFNGTAGIWRKKAIEEAGGWQHDTLTEDLDLSYRAQLKGWQFIYLPWLITPAELPVDMNAFKTQQHRWAKGAVQTCKKLLPAIWLSPLPLKIKLESTFHLTANFAYVLLLAMALLIQPNPEYGGLHFQSIVFLDLPVFFMASFSIFLFYGVVLWEMKTSWWKAWIYLPSIIAVGIGLSINNTKAVLEAVFNYTSPFNRTPKYGISSVREKWFNKRYVSSQSLLVLIEVALASYYVYFVYLGIKYELWTSLPFFILFMVGFGYVALQSLLQRPVELLRTRSFHLTRT
ncbi:MAG: cellulose synthase family protein [Verrucomicrobiota bacterium]